MPFESREDIGQNPHIQLVGNLSQQPVLTCDEIIKIKDCLGYFKVTFWQQVLLLSGITHLWPQLEIQHCSFETLLPHLYLCASSFPWKTWSRQGMRFAFLVEIWFVACLLWIFSHWCYSTHWKGVFLRLSKLMKTKWIIMTRVDTLKTQKPYKLLPPHTLIITAVFSVV